MKRDLSRLLCLLGLALIALASPNRALALRPSELVLIVNKNVPESRQLADLYCQLRNVPTNHVIALDLPFQDEMSFDQYETGVAGPVAAFLREHQLEGQVKCLVTFYGIPFRIGVRKNSDADKQELAELTDLQKALFSEATHQVQLLEQQTKSLDPTFKPITGTSLPELMARSQISIALSGQKLTQLQDHSQQAAALKVIVDGINALGGVAELDNRGGEARRHSADPTEAQKWTEIHNNILKARAQMGELQHKRWDPAARSQLRLFAHDDFGIFGMLRVLGAQLDYFQTDATGSCTDSELALVFWDYYPRAHMLGNPLKFDATHPAPPVMMVTRLDAPTPAIVERIIKDSVEVEKTGLDGTAAIDARGLYPDAKGNADAYAQYDERLRNLSVILRTKTNLKVRIDDQDIVFPPHSVKNVALYCGWYSVQNYIPGCDFVRGAIGFHIASYEMVTLHDGSSRWVRGLLTDGVDGTLGSVLEPGLDAFPKPDEFFPLLLTGKLTLAEVYWKTNPNTSWMMSFIGDPLYNPYKAHPALKVEDLPGRLGDAITQVEASTQPTRILAQPTPQSRPVTAP